MAAHRDQYVAVHRGAVIAHGPDQVEVAQQAYTTRAGYVPIYVGLVTDDPLPPVRIPSPRLLPGRDLLNRFTVVLDGPNLVLEMR
jgi:hypothetical protein